MNTKEEAIPWEQLVRYVAGSCDAREAAALSERIETESAVADALAAVLLHAVVVRDDAEAHPEPIQTAVLLDNKRSSWFIPAFFAAAAALAIASIALWFAAPGHRDRDILRITALDGSVRWTGAGGEVREVFATGARLPGGLLETISDDSTLMVAFIDGTTLTLLGRSAATFSADSQKSVHLRAGSLSADVRPQPSGRPLLIHTPTALLEVLGTRFEVDSSPASTVLTVNEGTVRVTRRVDGSVVEVTAEHQVVASLRTQEKLSPTPRVDPALTWASDLSAGPEGTEGAWLPPTPQRPAALRAEPKFLPDSRRGPVTIHRVSFRLPWDGLRTLQLKEDSILRLRGRLDRPVPIEIMFSTQKLKGGFAGNYFHETTPSAAGTWEIEVPASVFRAGNAESGRTLPAGLQLRNIVLYTINADAGLELEQVEILLPR